VNFWVKNSGGKRDAMLTFATVSFFVVTISIILSSIAEISIGKFRATFIPLDSGLASIYLGATFTAYVTRKYTDKKFEKENQPDLSTIASEIISGVIEGKNEGRKAKSTEDK
jgi:hypothetical protein